MSSDSGAYTGRMETDAEGLTYFLKYDKIVCLFLLSLFSLYLYLSCTSVKSTLCSWCVLRGGGC